MRISYLPEGESLHNSFAMSNDISELRQQLLRAEKKSVEEEQKRIKLEKSLAVAEKSNESLRTEILFLQRQTKETRDKDTSVQKNRGDSEGSPSCAGLNDQAAALKEENRELKVTVGRLKKLVDVLKRQKILLEANALLTVTERDLDGMLELDK